MCVCVYAHLCVCVCDTDHHLPPPWIFSEAAGPLRGIFLGDDGSLAERLRKDSECVGHTESAECAVSVAPVVVV